MSKSPVSSALIPMPHSETSPGQARLLSKAQLFLVNGLGFEGWLSRLIGSAQYHGPEVRASGTAITTAVSGEAKGLRDPHA
jgi:zinc/manganese transport system substrate-binding protein